MKTEQFDALESAEAAIREVLQVAAGVELVAWELFSVAIGPHPVTARNPGIAGTLTERLQAAYDAIDRYGREALRSIEYERARSDVPRSQCAESCDCNDSMCDSCRPARWRAVAGRVTGSAAPVSFQLPLLTCATGAPNETHNVAAANNTFRAHGKRIAELQEQLTELSASMSRGAQYRQGTLDRHDNELTKLRARVVMLEAKHSMGVT